MRNQRHHHVGRGPLPESFKHSHRRSVIHAHDQLQNAHKLGAAERPAISEHLVVHFLNSNSGELPKNVQRIENFLKVNERDFEWQTLALDLNLQSSSCVAMPAASIK